MAGGKLANLVNRELFAKIYLADIHRYTKIIFGICTDCSLFITNSFYLYGLPKFSRMVKTKLENTKLSVNAQQLAS